jgi:hypothetical protein
MGILQPTDNETFRMGVAVSGRVAVLAREHQKRRNRPLRPPQEVRAWMGKVAEMRLRHNRGEMMHTSEESRALGQLATWIVKQWHDLHGTEPPPQSSYYKP